MAEYLKDTLMWNLQPCVGHRTHCCDVQLTEKYIIEKC